MNMESNALLALLSQDARAQLIDVCTVVELVAQEPLWDSTIKSRYVYWPGSGVVSIMAALDRVPGMEVRMVGAEGLAGLHLVMGFSQTPLTATVQVSGLAWRCERAALQTLSVGGAALPGSFADVMGRYAGAVMAQLAGLAVCLRFHHIEQRLAKWLLWMQDRARSDQLHITQEALSVLMGVRRVSVTNAATALQDLGLIHYRRGQVSLLSRKGLEAQTCSCYRLDAQIYRSHMRTALFTQIVT